jgi:hypothetical protein
LQNYYALENKITEAICARFNIPIVMPEAVKILDVRMLMTEREQNMARSPAPWNDESVSPLAGVRLQYWRPERARIEFLKAFYECMKP